VTTFETAAGVVTITLGDRRLDAVRAPAFKQALIEHIVDRPKRVIVDASNIDFIDSTGLGMLVLILKLMGEGGRIAVVGIKAPVRRLFELTKLDSVFVLVEDLESAKVVLNA